MEDNGTVLAKIACGPTWTIVLLIIISYPCWSQNTVRDPSSLRLQYSPTARMQDSTIIHVDAGYYSGKNAYGLIRAGMFIANIAYIESGFFRIRAEEDETTPFAAVKLRLADNNTLAWAFGMHVIPVDEKYVQGQIVTAYGLCTYYGELGTLNLGLGLAKAPRTDMGPSIMTGFELHTMQRLKLAADFCTFYVEDAYILSIHLGLKYLFDFLSIESGIAMDEEEEMRLYLMTGISI